MISQSTQPFTTGQVSLSVEHTLIDQIISPCSCLIRSSRRVLPLCCRVFLWGTCIKTYVSKNLPLVGDQSRDSVTDAKLVQKPTCTSLPVLKNLSLFSDLFLSCCRYFWRIRVFFTQLGVNVIGFGEIDSLWTPPFVWDWIAHLAVCNTFSVGVSGVLPLILRA
jgi:hypothetical protein